MPPGLHNWESVNTNDVKNATGMQEVAWRENPRHRRGLLSAQPIERGEVPRSTSEYEDLGTEVLFL